MTQRHLLVGLLLAPLASSMTLLAQRVLYETDFSDAAGWDVVDNSPWWPIPGAYWNVDAAPANPLPPYVSPPSSLNFNNGAQPMPWGHWSGHATSPTIDLTGSVGRTVLSFEYGFQHEVNCEWDAFSVHVLDASDPSIVRFSRCLSSTAYAWHVWRREEILLDPAWGTIRIRFEHDTIDDWNFDDQGSFVDDVRVIEECAVTIQCEGPPLTSGAPGADLSIEGTTSIAARDLRLHGAGFPTHSFATAFAGPEPATIPLGAAVRCVAIGTSVRLGIAPTRDLGRPVWSLDLAAAPLAQLAAVGQPLYVQTIFRDGATVNLSDTLRLTLCP